jgi:hypothetical protein
MFSLLATLVALQPVPVNSADTPLPVRTFPAPLLANKSKTPPRRQEVIQLQDVRPLPGELDEVPVFNSNSPEIIRQSGILLSTFPTEGMANPNAHLTYEFKDRFDIFVHHVARSDRPEETPTLYVGVMLKNANPKKKVTVNLLQAASFLGTPDAPYISLPPQQNNDLGRLYSGPGGRVADVILRGRRQGNWPAEFEIGPGQSVMLMNLPIPLPIANKATPVPGRRILPRPQPGGTSNKRPRTVFRPATPSSNARSTLLQLQTKGKLYVASLAMLAPVASDGRELIPTQQDWEQLLQQGNLVTPRDVNPSPLTSVVPKFYYGRVAGVSQGSQWKAQLTDTPRTKKLTIPEPGQGFSYGIGTLQRGTFGTGQVQSAPMLARYPDTAYLAHGNYGVHYQLSLPLHNPSEQTRQVTVSFQTPMKQDSSSQGLRFYSPPLDEIFFRGTVRVRYESDQGTDVQQYFHLVQRQGELAKPLAMLTLKPKQSRLVTVDFVYPPDATPPQVLTVQTVPSSVTLAPEAFPTPADSMTAAPAKVPLTPQTPPLNTAQPPTTAILPGPELASPSLIESEGDGLRPAFGHRPPMLESNGLDTRAELEPSFPDPSEESVLPGTVESVSQVGLELLPEHSPALAHSANSR